MDLDESAQTPFAAYFPLPFRVLFLAGVGVLAWATNLHGLHLLGLDAPSALALRSRDNNRSRSPLPDSRMHVFKAVEPAESYYIPVYRLFRSYAVCCFFAWAFFRYATYGQHILVDAFRYIPGVCALGMILLLVYPYDAFERHERQAFLSSISRCLLPTENSPIYFSDVVFADIFTSFAKVLGDLWLSLCMLLPGNSLLAIPYQDGWLRWVPSTIMSLPYLVRLRQCVIEHKQNPDESRRHLLNALKYATSFPVIFLSAAQRIVDSETSSQRAWHGEHPLFRMWLLAAAVNSLYSFWWDVSNDWGLELLTVKTPLNRRFCTIRPLFSMLYRGSSKPVVLDNAGPNYGTSHLPGLRPKLLYPVPVYPMLIFLNLILRMTWSIKLSSHLYSHSEGGEVIFWLEVAELIRRWMWVFVRVEWEAVRREALGTRVVEIEEERDLLDSRIDVDS